MTDKTEDFNWTEVTGEVVGKLREPKVRPVPEPIIRQAQRSFDEGTALAYTFATDELAEAFMVHMKFAGLHTVPRTTIRVVRDPAGTGDTRRVSWKAGERRGRRS